MQNALSETATEPSPHPFRVHPPAKIEHPVDRSSPSTRACGPTQRNPIKPSADDSRTVAVVEHRLLNAQTAFGAVRESRTCPGRKSEIDGVHTRSPFDGPHSALLWDRATFGIGHEHSIIAGPIRGSVSTPPNGPSPTRSGYAATSDTSWPVMRCGSDCGERKARPADGHRRSATPAKSRCCTQCRCRRDHRRRGVPQDTNRGTRSGGQERDQSAESPIPNPAHGTVTLRGGWSLPRSVVATAASSSYKGHRYPREIIAHRRVVEELRAGRGPRAASPQAAPARAHITSTHEGYSRRSVVGADGSAHGRHRWVLRTTHGGRKVQVAAAWTPRWAGSGTPGGTCRSGSRRP